MKQSLIKSVIGVAYCFGLAACGPDIKSVSDAPQNRGAESEGGQRELMAIAVDVQQDTNALRLAAATSFKMSLEGCASGLAYSNITEATPNVDVYKYDQNCLIKLNSFVFNGIEYIPSSGDPFTTWLAGDIATFEDKNNPQNKIRVLVSTQLDNPISGTEAVAYTFVEIAAGLDKQIAKQVVGARHELSVGGQDATPLTIAAVSYTGMTAQGAGKFVFTLECGSAVTGSAPNLSCNGTALSNLKYRLVKDTFGGTLTYEQAQALFDGSEQTVADADKLGVGAGGTTNGGFVTKSGASILTGPNQMHLNPQMILIVQAGGASYRYFNVDVTTLSYP